MGFVFDTNVVVSAILTPDSIPATALNWGERNGLILYSDACFEELIHVLKRPKFSKYIDVLDLVGLFARIRRSWSFVPIIQQVRLCRDPKDDKFLEVAVNGKADYIITGDKDLLVLNPFRNVHIISPADFLKNRL